MRKHTVRFGFLALVFATSAAFSGHSWGQSSDQYKKKLLSLSVDGSATGISTYDPNAPVYAENEYVTGASGSDAQGAFTGTNINALLGATTFYNNGFTGSNAVIANVEAGYTWSGHEALAHVLQILPAATALNEVDRHATWVGMVLGGRPTASGNSYQQGMAPNAALYSGALAGQWGGGRYALSFTFFDSAYFDQYRKSFNTGVNVAGRTADVVNSSYGGGSDTTGTSTEAIGLDGLANANTHTLMVFAAGNGSGSPPAGPGAGFNHITVGALSPDPTFNSPASFTSGGPSPFSDPVHGTIAGAQRAAVDIAAPGVSIGSAYYGGTTGGNGTTDNPSISGTGPTGAASGAAGGADWYSHNIGGTSFSSPTVAGGAALVYDAGYANFPTNANARDARVVKAVLMNSADKTQDWNNGQVANPNGNGGVHTTQGLDYKVGTGRMNLDRAYHQYLDGTTDVAGQGHGNLGTVKTMGWDYGNVAQGTNNDYYLDTSLASGSTFTATLTWYRDRALNTDNSVADQSFDDLDLEFWTVVSGAPGVLISDSSSVYNNSEHFSFAVPAQGTYLVRVVWFQEIFDTINDANNEDYGLAWSNVAVPEPAMLSLLMLSGCLIVRRRR
jgi:hypothetical protein